MFNPFSGVARLEALIVGHTKLSDKARKVIAKLEAEETKAEDAVTEAIKHANVIGNSKIKAQKFLAKVEEFI